MFRDFHNAPTQVASREPVIEDPESDLDSVSDSQSEGWQPQYAAQSTSMPSATMTAFNTGGGDKTIIRPVRDSRTTTPDFDDLPALQTRSNLEQSDPLDAIYEDDPASYDLVVPAAGTADKEPYSLEKSSQALFSREHLQVIFSDSDYLLKFTSFLGVHRPHAVPLLIHYVDALKSIRAIHYANAILEGLDVIDDLDFTKTTLTPTRNQALEARATAAFDQLVKQELPAFITHQYIQVVSASISARISGSLAPHLREASEGLAEVFCLTDPSRTDNPIVFASEEFNRTTQYGMSYILGRNCRFLQGPATNPLSVKRLKDAIKAGKQHQEVFLNYRRDGSPFMNLLMTAPLCDSRGTVRYFIGAQVDVSGLVKECSELESLQHLLELQSHGLSPPDPQTPSPEKNDPLRELSEMMNVGEMSIIRRYGGKMHRETHDDDDASSVSGARRLMIKDPHALTPPLRDISGKLGGVYQHYLLIRPYPSLRILFASPSQRLPGVLQSPFLSKIGGSERVRQELQMAFMEGRPLTAKIRWISRLEDDGSASSGRAKYIHCTPLVGSNGNIGVWMVVIVDDGKTRSYAGSTRRMPPPVAVSSPDGARGRPGSGGGSVRATNGYHQGENGSINSFRIE